MALAFVQSWKSQGYTKTQTVNITGQTVGNLLVGLVILTSNSSTFSTPGGWVKREEKTQTGSSYTTGAMYTKVATAVEGNTSVTFSNTRESVFVVVEYSGADAISPIEASNDDNTYAAVNKANGGSIPCGSVTAVTAPNGKIGMLGVQNWDKCMNGQENISSGYIPDGYYGREVSNTPSAVFGLMATESTLTRNPNWTSDASLTWKANGFHLAVKLGGVVPPVDKRGLIVGADVINAMNVGNTAINRAYIGGTEIFN